MNLNSTGRKLGEVVAYFDYKNYFRKEKNVKTNKLATELKHAAREGKGE